MNNSSMIPNNATNYSLSISITINNYQYCNYWEPDTLLEYNAKRIAVILLMALGLAGNIFVIVLAMKYTVRKNLHHLIINMAVSDSLFILMGLIGWIGWLSNNTLWLTYPDGIFGDILCKTRVFLTQVSYRVTFVTLLIISIERFRATRRTLQRSRAYTLKQRVAVVGISWLIPMTLQSYSLYYYKCDPERGQCTPMEYKVYHKFNSISFCLKIIFTIVIFALSILTIRRLSRPLAIHAHLNQEQRKARARRTQAAVRMVLASVMLYTCCWVPAFIIHGVFMSMYFWGNTWILPYCINFESLWFIMYTFLPLFNSCFSPFIYIIFLSDFREGARKALCRKTDRNENRRNSMELRQMANNPPLEPEARRRSRYSNDEEEQQV